MLIKFEKNQNIYRTEEHFSLKIVNHGYTAADMAARKGSDRDLLLEALNKGFKGYTVIDKEEGTIEIHIPDSA